MIFAVFICTVLNHFVTARVLNVNINIRHRDTVGIKKALKQQSVFQRIKVGNIKRVCHDRACRASPPRAKYDPLRLAPVDKILHDQKIALVPHVRHNAEFHLNALAHLRREDCRNVVNRHRLNFIGSFVIIAARQTLIDELVQIRMLAFAIRQRIFRN